MKTLVTGGDGFVGQHLLARLLADGAEIVATTLTDDPALGTLDHAARGAVEWRTVDVLDREALDRLFESVRPARAFHLAGFSSGSLARARPVEALRVNAEGTLQLLEAAAAAGYEGPIVVAGSADAYGRGADEGDTPLGETTPLRPESAYGVSKAAQEVVALGAARACGLDVRVARLFPQIGPGQSEAFVLPSFCRRALRIAGGRAAPELRVGNLDIERDFADVREGAEALTRLSGLERPERRVYNVSSGRGTAVRLLLDWVLEAAGIEPQIVVDPALVREGEPRRVVGDPGRLARATGWSVERDLRVVVHDTFRWVRSVGAS